MKKIIIVMMCLLVCGCFDKENENIIDSITPDEISKVFEVVTDTEMSEVNEKEELKSENNEKISNDDIKESIKKDLTDLKLDLNKLGLPDQVFSQISCLTAAYNFLKDTELSNEEFLEKFNFDLTDVETWAYDQCIPWNEIEEKIDLNFEYVNYTDYSDYSNSKWSRGKLLTENIDKRNIMMLKIDSFVDDYIWINNVEYKDHSHWIIWIKYEGDLFNCKPSFISPVLPDIHTFDEIEESKELHYASTNEMVIISKK